jgi:hypothetical protein
VNREEEWTLAPGHTSDDAADDVKEHQVVGAIAVAPWSRRSRALESSSWRSVVRRAPVPVPEHVPSLPCLCQLHYRLEHAFRERKVREEKREEQEREPLVLCALVLKR